MPVSKICIYKLNNFPPLSPNFSLSKPRTNLSRAFQDELYETDQHLIGGGGQISGHDLYKPSAMGGGVGGGGGGLPVMLPGDHGGDGSGHHGIANPHEMDRLLGQRPGLDTYHSF